MWKTGVRQQNQNLQNEPGMSFGINATKKRGAEGARLNPNSVRPFQDLTHSLPMGYLPKTRLRHARIACIILQSQDLSFKPSGIQGEFLKANTDAEEPGATIPRGAAGEEESGSLRIFQRG